MKRLVNNFSSSVKKAPSALVALFVISVVGMNMLANKSIDTNIPWLSLDCGILFSAISFLSMDVITHINGLRCANYVSVFALLISLLVSLLFFVASIIPGVWAEGFTPDGVIDNAINSALNNTFRGTWYVIMGSSIAFLSSSLLNNFLSKTFSKFLKKEGAFSSFAIRSYTSTFIAQMADNLIFAFIVSKVFFGWSYIQCISCACVGALFELFFEIVISPIGFKVYKNWYDERLVCQDKEL